MTRPSTAIHIILERKNYWEMGVANDRAIAVPAPRSRPSDRAAARLAATALRSAIAATYTVCTLYALSLWIVR